MKCNDFIWVDLSSYNPRKTQKFYEDLFAWKFYIEDTYAVWTQRGREVCGLYETLDFFKAIRMPHFWMWYIQVDDVKEVVEKARALGATIEIKQDEFYGGDIALIRDPLWSGFTIYDGSGLGSKNKKEGHFISNELQISDITAVKTFYEGIFDWKIQKKGEGEFDILNKNNGEKIASILELDNSLKGKYEYWTVVFGVVNLEGSIAKIKSLWGELISHEWHRALLTDNSGEAFFYIEQL